MAIATITRVFGKNEAKNWPGSVTFSDGKKCSTWDDKLIAIADGALGQLAEYTYEEVAGKNGKTYLNLKSLMLKGASSPSAQQSEAPAPARGVDFGGAVIASAVKDLTAAVRELTSQLARQGSARVLLGSTAGSPAADSPATASAVDRFVEAEEKLAKATESPEAARAMCEAIEKKYAKNPDGRWPAVEKCLRAHGVEP